METLEAARQRTAIYPFLAAVFELWRAGLRRETHLVERSRYAHDNDDGPAYS